MITLKTTTTKDLPTENRGTINTYLYLTITDVKIGTVIIPKGYYYYKDENDIAHKLPNKGDINATIKLSDFEGFETQAPQLNSSYSSIDNIKQRMVELAMVKIDTELQAGTVANYGITSSAEFELVQWK